MAYREDRIAHEVESIPLICIIPPQGFPVAVRSINEDHYRMAVSLVGEVLAGDQLISFRDDLLPAIGEMKTGLVDSLENLFLEE